VSWNEARSDAVVIGAGFCGLTAAYELAKRGLRVTVLEQEPEIGGLAGSFVVNGTRLEKFYHHWFTSDRHVIELIHDLGAGDQILLRSTRTGMFYANKMLRLSSPFDVLRFKALPPIDRIRLGLLALRVKAVRNWKELETLSASAWLRQTAGDRVYEVVWEPLLRGKFGVYADDVSAVWFWNKLKLRGGSRGKGGGEQLAYFRGGFSALAERLAAQVRKYGGDIYTATKVTALAVSQARCQGVFIDGDFLPASTVIATPALPIIADLLEPHVTQAYVQRLRRIKYLASLCLVLELDRSLSKTYWLNVNDPGFPFVAVIEHTNLEPPNTYGGRHIVYVSKYLPETDQYFQFTHEEVLNYALLHLRKMFPKLERDWIKEYHVWRARYSQPIVERRYSELVPSPSTPVSGLYLASMAQIYPEDRGTNYAVREGRRVAALVSEDLVRRL